MKNKLARIDQWIDRHPAAYYWTTGLITGACWTFVIMKNQSK